MGGSGNILLAIPDGYAVEEGQPRGGSRYVSTRGREGTTVPLRRGREHGHGRFHHWRGGGAEDSWTEQQRCP